MLWIFHGSGFTVKGLVRIRIQCFAFLEVKALGLRNQ